MWLPGTAAAMPASIAASVVSIRSRTAFSTFFPLSAMPAYLHWIGWISPVWHGTELARLASYGAPVPPAMLVVHVGFLLACTVLGLVLSVRLYTRRLLS